LALNIYSKNSFPAAERSLFLGNELFAGSFGCGNDLVEAFITEQIIPAGIEEEIAV
jgi:hypothetical protein